MRCSALRDEATVEAEAVTVRGLHALVAWADGRASAFTAGTTISTAADAHKATRPFRAYRDSTASRGMENIGRLLRQLGDLREAPGFATPPRDGCAFVGSARCARSRGQCNVTRFIGARTRTSSAAGQASDVRPRPQRQLRTVLDASAAAPRPPVQGPPEPLARMGLGAVAAPLLTPVAVSVLAEADLEE